MSDLPQQTRRCYRHRAGLWWWECLPPQLQCRPWHLPSPAMQSRHRERSPPDARWGGGGWGGLCAGVGGGWRWSGGLSPAPTCAGWCRLQESDPVRRADPRRSGLPRTLQRGQLCNQSELTSACRIIAWRGARVEKEKTGEISTSSPTTSRTSTSPTWSFCPAWLAWLSPSVWRRSSVLGWAPDMSRLASVAPGSFWS